jgi:hypothetical protein
MKPITSSAAVMKPIAMYMIGSIMTPPRPAQSGQVNEFFTSLAWPHGSDQRASRLT